MTTHAHIATRALAALLISGVSLSAVACSSDSEPESQIQKDVNSAPNAKLTGKENGVVERNKKSKEETEDTDSNENSSQEGGELSENEQNDIEPVANKVSKEFTNKPQFDPNRDLSAQIDEMFDAQVFGYIDGEAISPIDMLKGMDENMVNDKLKEMESRIPFDRANSNYDILSAPEKIVFNYYIAELQQEMAQVPGIDTLKAHPNEFIKQGDNVIVPSTALHFTKDGEDSQLYDFEFMYYKDNGAWKLDALNTATVANDNYLRSKQMFKESQENRPKQPA